MNKTAIITGCRTGLGKAFTDNLLQRGWNVIGVSRTETTPEWVKANKRMHYISGSVAEDTTVDAAFDTAADLGNLKIVINCAGVGVFGEVGNYTSSDIDVAVEGNLAGLIMFSDTAVRHYRDKEVTIVNVMSTAAKKQRAMETVYTAVKWGAKAYTRTLRDALKSEKSPIRIIEVYPCGMHTEFWDKAVRPLTDGNSFPRPDPIANTVLESVLADADSYVQEFTFERS